MIQKMLKYIQRKRDENMKELIVATTNQGKVKEIQAMLKDLNIEVKSLKDVYDDVPDIVEDGKTFKENALIEGLPVIFALISMPCAILHKRKTKEPLNAA